MVLFGSWLVRSVQGILDSLSDSLSSFSGQQELPKIRPPPETVLVPSIPETGTSLDPGIIFQALESFTCVLIVRGFLQYSRISSLRNVILFNFAAADVKGRGRPC